MLNNPYLTRVLSALLFGFGSYLAAYNTQLSALVIHERSGMDIVAAVAIAVSTTGIELWFASWARNLKNLRDLYKSFQRKPFEIGGKLIATVFCLALTYQFDIETTRLSAGLKATDWYFFTWAVSWLVFGPEIAISLADWLWREGRDQLTRLSTENGHKNAEQRYRQSKERIMIDLAEQAGKSDGEQAAISRWQNNGHP